MTLTVQTKRCSDCGEHKAINAFHRESAARDGRYSYCKPCQNRRVLAWMRNARWETLIADAIASDWSTRHNAYDRPTAPNQACEHPVAEHWHGTNACYHLDRCRCHPCRIAEKAYTRLYMARKAGVKPSPMVPADEARAYVVRLMEVGMGPKRVAEVTGLPHGAISKLIYGDYGRGMPPSKRIKRATAERILACPYTVADGAKVDATEAKAIVAELVARGWAKAEIARRITGNPDAYALQRIKKSSPTVMAGTLRALRPLLDLQPPLRIHNPTGRTYVARQGYRWRRIAPNTLGVPPVGRERPLWEPDALPEPIKAPAPRLIGNGLLRCGGCGEALATHPITKRCVA